jgi:hypothetical protein
MGSCMFHGQLAMDNDFHGQNNFFLDVHIHGHFPYFSGQGQYFMDYFLEKLSMILDNL